MLKKERKSQTLADTISNILNVAPSSIDPEDDEDSKAKVTEGSIEDEDDEILLSKFRKQNIDFLEDVDKKYAGKKGSRKDVTDNDEDWITDEEIEQSNNSFDETESDNYSSDESSDNDEEEESSDDIESDDDSDANSIKSSIDNDNNFHIKDDDNFKQMHESNINTQIQKGMCVRNQLNIWETLLEIRIQLQKCLITANKMPQKDTFKEIRSQSSGKFNAKVNETKKNVENALDKLLELQSVLLKQYSETKKLFKAQEKGDDRNDEGDEEIPSNTDEENEEEIEETKEIPCKRRKLSDYENEIIRNCNTYSSYRNSVIQKWNDKTRIAVVKNNNPVHSVLNQIEHILNDKQKLIKRTQTKRSNYEIVGKKLNSGEKTANELNKENDAEIFDDDDFYHQLLRELIEAKSTDVTDPVRLGRQWIQLQNMRSKMKRNIDTRATKGRKIRYTVHTKLVNFMAPIDNNLYKEEAQTELYNSLFGKNQRIKS